jgi:hypothetical protein
MVEVILSTDLVRIHAKMMAEIDLMRVKYLIDATSVGLAPIDVTYLY